MLPPSVPAPRPDNICRGCGKTIRHGRTHCGQCAIDDATRRLADAARLGRMAAQPGSSCQARGFVSTACARVLGMEHIESTILADCQILFRQNAATPRRNINFGHSVSDRGISLVRRSHPSWLPPTSEALAGAGETRQCSVR